jgi:hypothetical protein
MKKINRRDYLKQMGTGAGIVIAGSRLNLLAQEKPHAAMANRCPPETTDTAAPLEWQPSSSSLPAANCVKLIFDGLMGFSPRRVSADTVHCDVGIHSKDDGDRHHRLFIRAYQTDDCKAGRRVPKLRVDNVEYAEVNLHVDKPDTAISKGVAFYQPAPNVMSRRDLANYPADWRWIVDFESNYLYRKHLKPKPNGSKFLKKNKNVYKTMFIVKNGVFYTLRKTASTFRAQTKNGAYFSDLGNVADVHGANIYLMADGKVTLTVKGYAPVDLVAPAEIYFSNRCLKDPDGNPDAPENHCDSEPYNIEDKKKRSDFYQNYQAFDYGVETNSGTKEYELFLLECNPQDAEPDVECESHRFAVNRFTDEAPCAGSGYGGGGGLPQFP